MTALISIIHPEFVLSVADRRSTIFDGKKYAIHDEQVNKHIHFKIKEMNCSATYCGFASWNANDGTKIKVDEVIGKAISFSIKNNFNFGSMIQFLKDSLNKEFDLLKKRGVRGPYLTIHIVGFTENFVEPIISIITDNGSIPDWTEESEQVDMPTNGRFKSSFAIRSQPTVLIGGSFAKYDNKFRIAENIEKMLKVSSIKPFDIANFSVKKIREVSELDVTVGKRVSAIVIPRNGFVDTGFWNIPNEGILGMMPRMVFINGTVWEPSEITLNINPIAGRLQRNGLLYRSILEGRTTRRTRRRYSAQKGEVFAPTITQILSYILFGSNEEKD